jgi:hypothetical protein
VVHVTHVTDVDEAVWASLCGGIQKQSSFSADFSRVARCVSRHPYCCRSGATPRTTLAPIRRCK